MFYLKGNSWYVILPTNELIIHSLCQLFKTDPWGSWLQSSGLNKGIDRWSSQWSPWLAKALS